MSERGLERHQVARLLERAAALQEQAARRGDEVDGAEAADTYPLAEIQAAADEAGIDPHFVALAALELVTPDTNPPALTSAQRRSAARWLGAREPAVRHGQRFTGPIEPLLAALGATVQSPRYDLRIAEATAEVRRGGTMLLAIPDFQVVVGAAGINMFAYYLRGVFDIEHLRLSITPAGANEHEVVVAVELGQAWPGMGRWGRILTACAAGLAAAIAWGIAGAAGLGVAGTLAIAAPALAITAWLCLRLLHWWYAYSVRQVQQQLQALLREVDGALRGQAIFGVLPASAPGDDGRSAERSEAGPSPSQRASSPK